MTILALEFSSRQRSVAVARGDSILSEAIETGERGVAAFAMIQDALSRAKIEREEIDAIAVGLGPGSYTGVRAAIALAQGWQLARPIKTIGVSSAAAIAARAQAEKIFGRAHVVVDAQRQEFYLATYDVGEAARIEIAPLKILPLADVRLRAEKGGILAGPDAEHFSNGRLIFPRAADVAALALSGNILPGDKLEPIYLRETTFVKQR